MASFSVSTGQVAVHAKLLAANTADTVTFADSLSKVEVISDGVGDLFVATDGTAATVKGSNCYRLVGAGAKMLPVKWDESASPSVSVISASATTYSVTKFD